MLSHLSLTDASLFVKLFEALLVCLTLPQKSSQLTKWTETITEAFFLHKALHAKEPSSDDQYTMEILDKISKAVDCLATEAESMCELDGALT